MPQKFRNLTKTSHLPRDICGPGNPIIIKFQILTSLKAKPQVLNLYLIPLLYLSSHGSKFPNKNDFFDNAVFEEPVESEGGFFGYRNM